MGAGRPSKYKPEYAEQAYKLCLLGFTDKELAFFFDVPEMVIEEWIVEIKEFRNAILNAMRDYPAYLAKKEKARLKRRAYRKQPHVKRKDSEYLKNKVKNDMHYRIRWNVSALIRRRLKNKKLGLFENLGYTVQELIDHLEKQFTEGMSWDNYGSVWHIDHITPDSWFKYESMDDEEFQKCWALDNLQPLFAEENLRKGNKYAGKKG